MADPVFLPPARLKKDMQSPLLLFGTWYETSFLDGLRWLSSIAYTLPFPCIVCPPFEPDSIGELLGLQVSLKVKGINTNSLIIQGDELSLPSGKTLKVQADFGFVGPAGKSFVIAQADKTAIVVMLQPKSTFTPFVLCGARLLSASGLSEESDRLTLLEALVSWAMARYRHTQVPPLEAVETTTLALPPETFKSICVLLAGTGAHNSQEIVALASSILGLDLSPDEVETGLNILAGDGLVKVKNALMSIQTELLEQYVQDLGLWPYVRILRRDFARKER